MCGIAGIFDLKAEREIDRNALERMTATLAHRGPDGEGFFIAPGIGFGHRRLAIIDRQGGAQPFQTQERACILSFNGEIYNYQALAHELSRDGLDLRTRSDTEVLAEGIALKGDAFLHRLRGMFAFSFWDPCTQRLTLARDRLGEKPLYYSETADGFLLFASELGAILASGLVETELNPQAVADYFFYGYVPDPKSIYHGVFKLPPAHILTAQRGKPHQLDRYWRPVFASGDALDFEDAAPMLRRHIDDAVTTQKISDVPLGAFLSGGVDSAAIVSSMAKSGKKVTACTIGFNEESHDERERARLIARKFGADLQEDVADLDVLALIDKVAAAFAEPFADSSALPAFLVSKLARQHVSVALSGDGGDEIFAGYRRYPFFQSEERLRRLAPHAIRQLIFGPAGMLYPKLDWAPRPLRFKTTFQALAMTRAQGYAAACSINLPSAASSILSRELHRSLEGYKPQSVIENAMNDARNDHPLALAQHTDLLTWLPGRMLTKIDRMSMAHSLEVRPPLLDHQLVEWAASLPPSYKLKNGVRKRIFKAAMTPRLGADYLNAPKKGFGAPLAAWFSHPNGNLIDHLNAATSWRESGLIDEASVGKMIRAHRSGSGNYAQELWSVIMFDAFLRTSRRP